MYTITEFSSKTGVSNRTLRFYEELGLLLPKERNQSGHRIYGMDELSRLQLIQSLKFTGYSLQEIKDLISNKQFNSDSFKGSLSFQRKIMMEKKAEIEDALNTIEKLDRLIDDGHEIHSDFITSIIYAAVNEEKQSEWLQNNFDSKLVNPESDDFNAEEMEQVWLDLQADIQKLMKENVSPESESAQAVFLKLGDTLKNLMPNAVDEEQLKTLEADLENAEDMDFSTPDFWSQKEIEYIEQIMKAMEEKYK